MKALYETKVFQFVVLGIVALVIEFLILGGPILNFIKFVDIQFSPAITEGKLVWVGLVGRRNSYCLYRIEYIVDGKVYSDTGRTFSDEYYIYRNLKEAEVPVKYSNTNRNHAIMVGDEGFLVSDGIWGLAIQLLYVALLVVGINSKKILRRMAKKSP